LKDLEEDLIRSHKGVQRYLLERPLTSGYYYDVSDEHRALPFWEQMQLGICWMIPAHRKVDLRDSWVFTRGHYEGRKQGHFSSHKEFLMAHPRRISHGIIMCESFPKTYP